MVTLKKSQIDVCLNGIWKLRWLKQFPLSVFSKSSLVDNIFGKISSVQFSSPVMSDSLRPHGLQHARPPCFITNSQSSLRLMSIELVMPSSHLILCRPLLLLASIFPSIRVFSNESALHIRWPKYWSFNFNISPSNEHSGLISFRMEISFRLDLLAVQGTLKSLLQYHSSKASILWSSISFKTTYLWQTHFFL